jgi:single-stranded DNA-binding protein
MSYIVRSGRLLSAGPLADTPGEEYVQIRVQVFDQFWSDTSPEMDTATTYTVMVVGQAAIQVSAIAEAGHRLAIVFSGRYLARGFSDEDGVKQISHEVIGDHVGIDLNEPLLARLEPPQGDL